MPNLFDLGLESFNEKNYAKAKGLFLRAIAENPAIAESHFYLGQCHFFCDEPQQAISSLKTFIQLRQNSVETDHRANVAYAFDTLGRCYEAQRLDTAALTCYQTATKIHTTCASAWHNMGLLYLKFARHYLKSDIANTVKLFDLAKTFICNALKLCSENPSFLHSVASWYEQYIEVLDQVTTDEKLVQENITRNFDYAIQYYQAALAACGETDVNLSVDILSNLTECLAQYGHHFYNNEDYTKAQEMYLKAIQRDPQHLVAISQMGMTFFKQNNFFEARESFSSILHKTEDKQELADAWLNIACTYRFEKEWVWAQDALNKAKILAPEDSSITDEEMELTNAQLASIHISTTHSLFGNSNPASQHTEYKREEESNLQFK